MGKKKLTINSENILLLIATLVIVSAFGQKKRKKHDMEQAVLDASEINGKPLGVSPNGELIIYEKK
jgi:hypothetical protein